MSTELNTKKSKSYYNFTVCTSSLNLKLKTIKGVGYYMSHYTESVRLVTVTRSRGSLGA